MKQKFQGKTLTKRKVINNILRFYEESTAIEQQNGLDWYKDAHLFAEEMAKNTNTHIMNVIGVISALSPQTSWELNKVYAVRFLRDGLKAKANTTANKIKAKKCLEATSVDEIRTILNGSKTVAFFWNILFYNIDGTATIDRHAVAICLQRPDKTEAISEGVQLTQTQYNFFEECYCDAANKLDILSHELQAVTWVTYRRLRGLK